MTLSTHAWRLWASLHALNGSEHTSATADGVSTANPLKLPQEVPTVTPTEHTTEVVDVSKSAPVIETEDTKSEKLAVDKDAEVDKEKDSKSEAVVEPVARPASTKNQTPMNLFDHIGAFAEVSYKSEHTFWRANTN